MSEKSFELIYDGQCPVCQRYARLLRIRESVGDLRLINARENPAAVEELRATGYDVDEGMALRMEGQLYFGADALNALALLGTRVGVFNRLNYFLFRSRFLSRIAYPVLRGGRNLLLRLLGISKINAPAQSDVAADSYLQKMLFSPVDAASVAVFRVGFGLVMLIDAIGHLFFINMDLMFVQPTFMFRYFGFEWVPLLREGVYVVYAAIGLASIGVMLGYLYRISAIVVAVGTAWVFLQDQAQYLNHMYLLILYSVLMVFIPANRYWSLDAHRKPAFESATLPAWCRLLLVLQIEIILIYAGLVKITPDWLAGEPLTSWLAKRADMPFFGELFTQPLVVQAAAYSVIGLHLLGAPLLLVKGVRFYVLGVYACFHVLNHFVFDIGVFPWVTLFASLVCFEPDWPRQLYARYKKQTYVPPSLPALPMPSAPMRALVCVLFGIWLSYQVLMPVRNFAYAGDVAWNEQGHRFSWRMKLRSKRGEFRFVIIDSEKGRRWRVDPRAFLRGRQIFKVPCQPDMILQMAHYMRDTVAPDKYGIENARVYVDGVCSLNYRRMAVLINPQVDLAAETRHLGNNSWIVPLDVPLTERLTNAEFRSAFKTGR